MSKATGRHFELWIWTPRCPPPPGGFPVLYCFDADTSFGTLVDTARALNAAAGRVGLPPVMIAAIGYPGGESPVDRRIYDMTPVPDDYGMPERPNGQPWPKLGGGDAFVQMIEDDIKPVVRNRFPTGREILYGHSLGGLMTLHYMLTKPLAFDCYVASSPSLWVNGGRLMRDCESALAGADFPSAHVPLHLSVGADEEKPMEWDMLDERNLAARRAWVAGNAMVTRCRDLADLIEAKGTGKIALDFRILPGQDHHSAKALSSFRAVKIAIEQGASQPIDVR